MSRGNATSSKLWIWSKGQLISEIPLKLVRSSESGTSREHDVLMVAKVPHHPKIKPGLRRLTCLLRGPMKELHTRGQVRKHLVLDEDAGKPPIPIPGARINPVTAASVRSPLSFALLEPKR